MKKKENRKEKERIRKEAGKKRKEAASLIPDEERKRKGKERVLGLVLEQWIFARYH